ncbi:MAG: hypothetical protein SFU56_02125 [Capsulimonadales bacterium]|nr:hypothetical protein [Capsulimonadales bacterium]
MPLLDPRHYRVDDLLRRPFQMGGPLLASCPPFRAEAIDDWGFPGGLFAVGDVYATELGPLRLRLFGDGETVLPSDGIDRPSHLTLNAADPVSGLQVTEDKFIAEDGTAVSVLSLRNARDLPISVRVDARFGLSNGERIETGSETWVTYREGPPGDDLRFRLNPFTVRTLIFAIALGRTEDEARQRVMQRRYGSDPIRRQQEETQRWFDAFVPNFDCSDPWFQRLWYHRWQLVRRNGIDLDRSGCEELARRIDALEPGAESDATISALWEEYCRSQFVEGHFDRPFIPVGEPVDGLGSLPGADGRPVCLWAERLLANHLGIRREAGKLAVQPIFSTPPWRYFCVDRWAASGTEVTMVWDDPTEPEDAFHDGDKGFSVFRDEIRLLKQESPSAVSLSVDAFQGDEGE